MELDGDIPNVPTSELLHELAKKGGLMDKIEHDVDLLIDAFEEERAKRLMLRLECDRQIKEIADLKTQLAKAQLSDVINRQMLDQ